RFFQASPALVRAVHEAVAALRERGAQVEAFEPPDMHEAVRIYLGLISADGGADAARRVGSSQRDWRVERLLTIGGAPRWLRGLLGGLARLGGQRCTAEMLAMIGSLSAHQFWQLSRARAEYAERFFRAWSEARLDVLI